MTMRTKLVEAVDLLVSANELPPGYHHKGYDNWDGVYSVRLSKGYRFLYRVEDDGSGRAVAVGTHDQVALALKRS